MSSPNISEITTTTLRNYSKTIQDAATNNVALLNFLKEKGKIKYADGGEDILQHMEYALNSTAKWYSGYDVLDTTPQDVVTSSHWAWKQASVNVVCSGLETEVQNTGKEKLKDLLNIRIKNAEKSIIDVVEAGLYSDGTGTGGKQIGGLLLLVPDDPTTGTVGGINRATQTWWRSVALDISTAGSTFDNTTAKTHMNAMYIQLVRNKEKPDVILAGDTYYTAYESSLQAIQRIGEVKTGNAGFENLLYKNIPVVLAGGKGGHIADTRMYFLNTDYIYFRPSKNRYFAPDTKRYAFNQDAMVVPLFFAGNMTASNLAMQGVICA